MNSHYSRLFQQLKSLQPEYSSVLRTLNSKNIMLNYPICLSSVEGSESSSNKSLQLRLRSESTIRKQNKVALFEASKTVFSSGFLTGATASEQEHLNNRLKELHGKYDIFSPEITNQIKTGISIMANRLDSDLPLHEYAEFLFEQQRHSQRLKYVDIGFKNTKSIFLKNVLNSNKNVIDTTFKFLSSSVLNNSRVSDFQISFNAAKHFSRRTHQYGVIFPFSQYIGHSFEPNCEIRVLHLMHRRQNFLVLQSIRDIGAGEQLTINFGNEGNHVLFARYGVVVEDNPYTQFVLPLDYSGIAEVFNSNIDWKMELIKKNLKFKLKNFVRITREGRIHPQDLNMLKIIFCDEVLTKEQFNQQSRSESLEKSAYQFVRQFAKATFTMMSKAQKQLEKSTGASSPSGSQSAFSSQVIKNIRLIEKEEKLIMEKLIQTN